MYTSIVICIYIYIYIYITIYIVYNIFTLIYTKKQCPVRYLLDESWFDGKAIRFVKHGAVQVHWIIIATN